MLFNTGAVYEYPDVLEGRRRTQPEPDWEEVMRSCNLYDFQEHTAQSCRVYLPAGFMHSPWVIRRVDRPFIAVTVCQETGHTDKPYPELLSEVERDKTIGWPDEPACK